MSIVSRTAVAPIELGGVGNAAVPGVRSRAGDEGASEEGLLKKVCRLLESAGLSVVVVVALDAGPAVQPNPHTLARSRRAGPTTGLSVVPTLGGSNGQAARSSAVTDHYLPSSNAERPMATGSMVDSGVEPRLGPVIVLTTAQDEYAARAAVEAGGLGYLVKEGAPASGALMMMPPAGVGAVPEGPATGPLNDIAAPPAPTYGLTSREIQVLQALANGSSTTEVARELFVSPKTVKNHLAHVYAKLGVASRTQAVAKAVRLGIVNIG